MVFDEGDVKVTSTSLPDLFPSSYRVCGRLYSTTSTGPYKLKISSSNGAFLEEITSDGKYCIYLKPGKYSFSPTVDDNQKTEGLV